MTLPTYPGPGAPAADLAAYQAALDLYRAETARMHAQAQADTAVAMQASVQAQQALADAMAQPVPVRKPTRAELIWQLTLEQPQASILTPGQIVSGATQIVDAYIKVHPDAVEG